jgi:Peptidase A4 family
MTLRMFIGLTENFLSACLISGMALTAPAVAYGQAPASTPSEAVAVKRYVPASVQAAAGLQCKLHASDRAPASGLIVFTDGDGYARFHAVRQRLGSAAQHLTLSCADEAGRPSSYPVDLASDATFVARPLNIANERGIDRPPLRGDPLSYSQAQLSREGYGLRPDPAGAPAAYASWYEAATKPGRMLYAKRSDGRAHTVTTSTAPPWIGSVMTGSAPYKSITATFEVPTTIPGAFGTTSTEAAIWPGLGGFGTGSGLIQAGVILSTTPTSASYMTWREYCCGDPDSNGYGGAFVPSPGDKILAQAWYCDANGQSDIGGGFGCSYLYDFQSGAVFSCTIPRGDPSNPPCWSVKALPLCSVNRVQNCMTLGTSAEFIL